MKVIVDLINEFNNSQQETVKELNEINSLNESLKNKVGGLISELKSMISHAKKVNQDKTQSIINGLNGLVNKNLPDTEKKKITEIRKALNSLKRRL